MTEEHTESTTTPGAPEATEAVETAESLGAALGSELGASLGTAEDESVSPEEQARLAEPEPPDAAGFWRGTGRRKSAVARVRIRPGDGDVKIQVARKQYKSVEDYFPELRDRHDVYAPLKQTQTFGKLDVVARLTGGGQMGQAQAMRLGIARALKRYDPTLERVLRDAGYLTRDPREVERKKYGQPGARKRFQFSKR